MKYLFFNHFHNGDIHISRGIVSKIIEKVKAFQPNSEFFYAHSNDLCLVKDIPNLTSIPLKSIQIKDEYSNLQNIQGYTTISTWYAQQRHKYMNTYGMTIDCLYAALDQTCQQLWNFSLQNISTDIADFFPTIDYSKFEISNAQGWLSRNHSKKIFVSNGNSLSGQAVNFHMTPIIYDIAKNHPDKLFILSNKDTCTLNLPNVEYSSDIINKTTGNDLNENSFLTTFCDVIIGRASGAFSYAWTRQNMLERQVKFITFCTPSVVINPPYKYWSSSLFSSKIDYSAEFVVSGETDSKKVFDIINQNI